MQQNNDRPSIKSRRGTRSSSVLHSTTSTAKVNQLKSQVRYLLERQRLLAADVYEREPHEQRGVDFRYEAVSFVSALVGEELDGLASPSPVVELLRLPEREVVGEDEVRAYLVGVVALRRRLSAHCSVTSSVKPGRVLLSDSQAMICGCMEMRRGGSGCFRFDFIVKIVKPQVPSTGACECDGGPGSSPVTSEGCASLASACSGWCAECSVDMLAIFESMYELDRVHPATIHPCCSSLSGWSLFDGQQEQDIISPCCWSPVEYPDRRSPDITKSADSSPTSPFCPPSNLPVHFL